MGGSSAFSPQEVETMFLASDRTAIVQQNWIRLSEVAFSFREALQLPIIDAFCQSPTPCLRLEVAFAPLLQLKRVGSALVVENVLVIK
jgi:hypothetical protein